jgi:hypothetical protein
VLAEARSPRQPQLLAGRPALAAPWLQRDHQWPREAARRACSPTAWNSRSLPPPTPVKQTDRGEAGERNAAGVAVLRKAWGLTARSWLAWGTLRRLTPAFGNGRLGMTSWNKSRPSAIYHAECNNSLDTRQCSRLERPP